MTMKDFLKNELMQKNWLIFKTILTIILRSFLGRVCLNYKKLT